MRTPAAVLTGIVIGIVAAGIVFLAVERRSAPPLHKEHSEQARSPAVIAAPAVGTPEGGALPSRPSRSMPVRPAYRSTTEATRPIYRCTSHGATVYSNDPCAGATVVAGTDGAAGYDSRPSDRLARLVAEGRPAEGSGPLVVSRSRSAPRLESVECGNLRQQIRDLDAAATYPNSRETLDEWRRIRQDIRTSMARSHC